MHKIITALDGFDISKSAVDYTIFMARHCNAHVVGVFLDDATYHSYRFSELVSESGGISDDHLQELNNQDNIKRDVAVQVFEMACNQAGLQHAIHRDRNIALQELLHESIYADLLIIDSKESFSRFHRSQPSEFMRDLLADIQCPVLVVPQTYRPAEKLIFLYDGEPASVHAVKMFSYLLPDLKNMETEVLSIKDKNETLHVPDNRLMKEFMRQHFPNAAYTVLKGEPELKILDYINQLQQDSLVVLGAYQRSRVSRWFKPSMADHLLRNLKVPLFIAHNT